MRVDCACATGVARAHEQMTRRANRGSIGDGRGKPRAHLLSYKSGNQAL
jgi:hypothetical protein